MVCIYSLIAEYVTSLFNTAPSSDIILQTAIGSAPCDSDFRNQTLDIGETSSHQHVAHCLLRLLHREEHSALVCASSKSATQSECGIPVAARGRSQTLLVSSVFASEQDRKPGGPLVTKH